MGLVISDLVHAVVSQWSRFNICPNRLLQEGYSSMKKVFPQALVFLVACSNSASDNEPGTNLGATQLWARSDVQMPGDEMGLGSWPIEIIYPAAGAGHSLTYIDNPVILEAMIEAEYYDVAPPELRGWGEGQAPF
jgi:hypothetical protein